VAGDSCHMPRSMIQLRSLLREDPSPSPSTHATTNKIRLLCLAAFQAGRPHSRVTGLSRFQAKQPAKYILHLERESAPLPNAYIHLNVELLVVDTHPCLAQRTGAALPSPIASWDHIPTGEAPQRRQVNHRPNILHPFPE
jgi:hypothetical protein